MRASIIIIAGALFGGIIGADTLTIALVAGLLGGLGLLCSFHYPRFRVRHLVTWACLWLGSVWVGTTSGGLPKQTVAPDVRALIEGTVVANGCSHNRRNKRRCTLTLRGVRLAPPGGGVLPGVVTLLGPRSDLETVSVGSHVVIDAWLEGERTQPNPGVGWVGRQPWFRWTGRALSPPVVRDGVDLAAAVRESLSGGLGGQSTVSGLYRAILLGDRRYLQPAVRDAFIDTGTAHILAISGLHLAVIAAFVFRLFLALFMTWRPLFQAGRPRVPAAAVTIVFMWCYAAMVGSQSLATLRAALFITVYLGALVLARQPSPGRSLWVAAAVLSLVDPRSLLTPSFQLSFAAAGGLTAAAKHLRGMNAWWDAPGRLPDVRWVRPMKFLSSVLATTLICQAATAPVALAWFGQSAWLGVVVNIAAVPLTVLLVVPLGFIWLVTAALWPSAGSVVGLIAEFPAQWLLDTVDIWSQWLGPSQQGMIPHVWGVLLGAAVCGVLTWRPVWRVGGALVGFMALLLMPTGGAERLELVALDVGHGDALIVKLPNEAVMLVDTGGGYGSHTNTWIADYRLIPALARLGISRIDVLAISHAHLDHLGAASRLAQRVEIGEVWIPPCGIDSSAMRSLTKTVEKRGGRVQIVDLSQSPRFFGDARVHVLWPDRRSVLEDGRCVVGANDASVVLRVDYAGRRALLSGDIEALTELELLESNPDALRADVLKVPHHGSRTSSLPEFVEAVNPQWAIVTGAFHRRDRRPPHRSVIARYRRHGARTVVTGEHGAVRVVVKPDGSMDLSASDSGRLP